MSAVPDSAIARLLAIMERLRAPGGCPWDREQTFSTIAPYTIEEAYEVADAIAGGMTSEIKDELGDLLFQVVFHAQIAREAGLFDFDAVAQAIGEKLVRRHPHVFGADADGAAAGAPREGPPDLGAQSLQWEDIKARERAAKTHGRPADAPPSHLDGVPRALPALMRASKISQRAARVGFDWAEAGQTADKVAEELSEVREAALEAGRSPGDGHAAERLKEEVGDLLFAAANLARKLGVDAEAALRAANDKFERRFRGMEALALASGQRFADLGLEAQERLWEDVKRAE